MPSHEHDEIEISHISIASRLSPSEMRSKRYLKWIKAGSMTAGSLNEAVAFIPCEGCGGGNLMTFEHAVRHGARKEIVMIFYPNAMESFFNDALKNSGVTIESLVDIIEDDQETTSTSETEPGSTPLPSWLTE